MPRKYTKKTADPVRLPNLYKVIYEDFGSISAFCEASGLSAFTLYNALYGRRRLTKYSIDAIVEAAGRSQEWLFKEVE